MFLPDVKERAMVGCARHCCICRKFCGTKMECHHITPEAEGGPDTFENCIPLCFDCHAEVMSYNDKHPKGTKFRPGELLQHRDNWYTIIAAGPIYTRDNQSLDVDRNLFKKVRDTLASGHVIDFLRNQDFGGTFSFESLFAVEEFWHFSKLPETEFLDPRTQGLFAALRSSVRHFLDKTRNSIFVVNQGSRLFGVPPEWLQTRYLQDGSPDNSQAKRFEDAVTLLNASASQVAEAYDSFVREGRKILLTD